MRKKTRSKLSSSLFTLSEKLVYNLTNLFCLAGIVLNVYLFYKSYNMSLVKLNEEPIAIITFKYNTAQRRFEERAVWDRLKQESPIYNGDTIRTAALSEATIHFSDGNVMNLTDNTMTQVYLNEDKTLEAKLSGGSITIDSSGAESDAVLSYNGVTVKLEAGSTLNMSGSEDGEGFAVQVYEGNAVVESADGNTTSVKEGDVLSLDEKGTRVKKNIIIKSPRIQEKILYHTKENLSVPFEWQLENITNDTPLALEIYRDSNFTKQIATFDVTGLSEYTAELPEGNCWWRIVATEKEGGDAYAVAGKLQIMQSLPPRPITPVMEYQYQFRKQLPAVRFTWSEARHATSYELTVASNPDMKNPQVVQRTPLPSSIISTLGSGTWYWQVTPFYSVNNIGLEAPSEKGMFVISRQGELLPPKLQFPGKNAFVNTKTASKAVNFSWKTEREAVSYIFTVSKNENMRNPVATLTTSNNFIPIDFTSEGENSVSIPNGQWFWSIKSVDIEGNTSAASEVRSFYAVDGTIVQRTVYPPDGYSVSQNLLSDMRFTWKTNIPSDNYMEISTTENFSKIAWSALSGDEVRSGVQLQPGEYYWRIKSEVDGRPLQTPPKKLTVLEPLPAPGCIAPSVVSKALVRPGTPFVFKWSEVEGANYYKIVLSRSGENEILYEENLIEGTERSITLENFDEGLYTWKIQAFAFETPLSSRRSGKLGEAQFELRKIHPVELMEPKNKARLPGVQAIMNPGKAQWNTKDRVGNSKLVIERIDTNETVLSMPNPPKSVRLPRLHSGQYKWTVHAMSTDGYDLSPEKPHYFTVLPIEPLENVRGLVPEKKHKFDVQYFVENKFIKFKWEPVKDATGYMFTLYDKGGKILKKERLDKTEYTFDDISKLGRGSFKWSVQAFNTIHDGTILQESPLAQQEFIINLPELKDTRLQNRTLYGR